MGGAACGPRNGRRGRCARLTPERASVPLGTITGCAAPSSWAQHHTGYPMTLAPYLLLTALQATAGAPLPGSPQEVSTMSTFHKPSDEELHKRLTREQYDVTQHEATERPFRNEYWDNHQSGIYV